jgi:hypothetical protein
LRAYSCSTTCRPHQVRTGPPGRAKIRRASSVSSRRGHAKNSPKPFVTPELPKQNFRSRLMNRPKHAPNGLRMLRQLSPAATCPPLRAYTVDHLRHGERLAVVASTEARSTTGLPRLVREGRSATACLIIRADCGADAGCRTASAQSTRRGHSTVSSAACSDRNADSRCSLLPHRQRLARFPCGPGGLSRIVAACGFHVRVRPRAFHTLRRSAARPLWRAQHAVKERALDCALGRPPLPASVPERRTGSRLSASSEPFVCPFAVIANTGASTTTGPPRLVREGRSATACSTIRADCGADAGCPTAFAQSTRRGRSTVSSAACSDRNADRRRSLLTAPAAVCSLSVRSGWAVADRCFLRLARPRPPSRLPYFAPLRRSPSVAGAARRQGTSP